MFILQTKFSTRIKKKLQKDKKIILHRRYEYGDANKSKIAMVAIAYFYCTQSKIFVQRSATYTL